MTNSTTTTKIAEATPIPPHKKLLNCIINRLLKQSITKTTATATEQLENQRSGTKKNSRKTAENKDVELKKSMLLVIPAQLSNIYAHKGKINNVLLF